MPKNSSCLSKTAFEDVPVCVVIPFFDARETLRNAVFSVLNQSYHSWQLILLNDGSIDDSVDTIADLVDNDRVLLVSDNTNRGLIYRLNQMVKLTDAPFIARMDADDLMHPDRLRFQMEAFRTDPLLDIVSTGMAIMNGDYQVKGVRCVGRQPTLRDFMRDGGLVHASCIFRRKFLETNKYNPGFLGAEDRELFLRVIPNFHYYCVTKPLYLCTEYDRFDKRRYLNSYRSERKAILSHGPRLIGWPATVAFFLRSVLKEPAVHIMSVLGLANYITRRTYVSSHENELLNLQALVDTILTTSANQAPLTVR